MAEPIRVLHVVTHMNRGGLETMIMNYYRHIDRTKIQFDFLTHRDGKKDYDDEIQKLGGKIYHLPPLNPLDKKGYLKKLDDFFREHPEYKVVHSHLDCMSAYPLRTAKKYGVPVRIAHSHNTSQERNLKYLIKLYSRSLIPKYATDLFACGEEAGKWMFKNRSFVVMRNAIDAQKFVYNSEVAKQKREELGIEDKFVFGHVGRFNLQKNHEFLIEIFNEVCKRNENAVLLLVGTGELEEKIHEKVRNLGLNEKVMFLGVREDIPELMQAMDVFVFPSLFEGLPVTLVEAQAAGLPCVVSGTITKEIDIIGKMRFLDINGTTFEWAKEIEKKRERKKEACHMIEEKGFDIKKNAEWFQKFILQKSGNSLESEKYRGEI